MELDHHATSVDSGLSPPMGWIGTICFSVKLKEVSDFT